MGYQRLNSAKYRDRDEPEITGELARAVREAGEDPSAPRWTARYAVRDELPVKAPGRFGKHRKVVDIEFVRVQPGPRPRLLFEAKRLRDGSSVGQYVGKDGLGCFLSGDYALDQQEAGMLGYVQTDGEVAWAQRIRSRLEQKRDDCAIRRDGGWQAVAMAPGLRYTYRTRHDRKAVGSPITIYHVLLRFC